MWKNLKTKFGVVKNHEIQIETQKKGYVDHRYPLS